MGGVNFLGNLRRICLALPEARETTTFGHPTFQAGKRTFAVLDRYGGEECLVVKLELPHQQARLKSPRFFPSPYGAKHGWVCMHTSGRLDWAEIGALCIESYRAVALKRMLTVLDGLASAQRKPAAIPKGIARSKARSKR